MMIVPHTNSHKTRTNKIPNRDANRNWTKKPTKLKSPTTNTSNTHAHTGTLARETDDCDDDGIKRIDELNEIYRKINHQNETETRRKVTAAERKQRQQRGGDDGGGGGGDDGGPNKNIDDERIWKMKCNVLGACVYVFNSMRFRF